MTEKQTPPFQRLLPLCSSVKILTFSPWEQQFTWPTPPWGWAIRFFFHDDWLVFGLDSLLLLLPLGKKNHKSDPVPKAVHFFWLFSTFVVNVCLDSRVANLPTGDDNWLVSPPPKLFTGFWKNGCEVKMLLTPCLSLGVGRKLYAWGHITFCISGNCFPAWHRRSVLRQDQLSAPGWLGWQWESRKVRHWYIRSFPGL